MPRRDLKLNSLSRHSKQSLQFILEEHGHCEVPAGCGGVVLRWRNPNQGIPLQIWPYLAGKYEMLLDGASLPSGRPIIPWGRHVWSFVLPEVNPEYAVLMFAAFYDEKESHIKTTGPAVEPVSIFSKSDGSWKYSPVVPVDVAWMRVGFDDSAWLPMTPTALVPAALERMSRESYRIQKLQGLGAEPLGIAAGGSGLWIRKEFTLTAPEA